MDSRAFLSSLKLALLYALLAFLSLAGSRFDGGVAFIWLSTALLTARLVALPKSQWAMPLVLCLSTGMVATGLFGLGWAYAPTFGAANVGEAALSAYLIKRAGRDLKSFGSLAWLLKFFVYAGVIAPLASGLVGPLSTSWLFGQPAMTNYLHWAIGHGLGNIAFIPLFTFVMTDEWRRSVKGTTPGRFAEVFGTIIGVAAVCGAVFSQQSMPLLFLPVMAIVVATFRLGRFGATISLAILIAISGAMTLGGQGPVQLLGGTIGLKVQFLQFYLAATVLTVLPVAADLSRRNTLYRALHESEARYRLLADHSTDIIMNLDLDGIIRFVSSSVRQLGGYEPADLVGVSARQLIAPEYRDEVRAAHVRALTFPNMSVAVEYEALTQDGERRWFETNMRAIVIEDGSAEGTVSIIRDISNRKSLEARLAKAAHTDPLTGLPNRRAFELQMASLIASDRRGCVAVFDIDHFKAINDTYGHAGGDAVLANFADVAATALRTTDMIARIGGEEFAVLLPEANGDQARLICERLILTVSEASIHYSGNEIRCTVSCGVAILTDNSEQCLDDADRALYRAKQAGRDRLMMAA